MEAPAKAWAGHGDPRADPRSRGYGAKQGMCFEPAAHYGFCARVDRDRVDRAVAGTPGSAVGPYGYDEHHAYPSRGNAGERFEHVAHDDWSTGAEAIGLSGTTGTP